MKTYKDPMKTSAKGLDNSARVRVVVRHIQNKILDSGLCSDREYEFLVRHAGAEQPKYLVKTPELLYNDK
jgi:hypothetical protein